MTLSLLKRSLAPIVPRAWELIDVEARRVLQQNLAGRRLVDVSGPQGWQLASVNTGRLTLLDESPIEGVQMGLREVLPLMELRAPIRLAMMEVDTVARGRDDPDLSRVVEVARRMAWAEDGAIFNGNQAAGVTGILGSSPHEPLSIETPSDWARVVLQAKERLRQAGITGPHAMALGTEYYDELMATTVNGYPVIEQIQRQILQGPVVHAPACAEGVLLSVRGGDYVLTLGQDMSIGYAVHDRDEVELYLTESFTFRVLEPGAAVRLRRR